MATALVATPALAAGNGVEPSEPAPILVMARKKPEALFDVPGSVSVIGGPRMEDARLREFRDLPAIVPNVAMSGGLAGQLQGQMAIRGIATLVRNIGVESGVGIYVDGAYIGRPDAYDQDLLDIEQVEVLRGPQGTMFGKNTIAGVFNMVSAAPTEHFSAKLLAEGGDYDLVRVQATVSGPLAGPALLGRLALGYASRDGFSRHRSGGRAADALDRFSWRGALAWGEGSAIAVTLRADGSRDRGVPGFFSSTDIAGEGAPPPLPRGSIDNNRPNRLSRDLWGLSLTAEGDVGEARLTSISAYRHARYTASVDDDQRQIDLLSADEFGDRSEIVSQEIRVAGETGALSYVAGLYFLDQVVETSRTLALGETIMSQYGLSGSLPLFTRGKVAMSTYAAFGNVDWQLATRLTLGVGLRYTHETKSARFTQGDPTGVFTMLGFPEIVFRDRSRDNDVSPTLSLSYQLAPEVRLYARAARAFKSTSFNVDIATSAEGLTAGPEKATTYEAGIKAFNLGPIGQLTLTGFHTDYRDLQVSQITGGGTMLTNAASARIRGFELELVAHPVKALQLEGALGLANGRYRRFERCAAPLSEGGGVADCSGKRLTGAPRFTASGAIQYSHDVADGSLSARLEANHQSAVNFEPTNSSRFQGRARTLLNARLSLRLPSVRVSAWVENLTDAVYETYRDDRTGLGVLRTTAYGSPRTWGVSVAKPF